MNEPELNHLSWTELPGLPTRLSGHLLLVLASLFTSLMLAGAAFGYTDQNADLRAQVLEQQERQRQEATAKAEPRARVTVAQAGTAPQSRRDKDKPRKESAR